MITCDNQETILAVADGSSKDEYTISSVLKHIADCKKCRTLYEDYFLVYNGKEKENTQNTIEAIAEKYQLLKKFLYYRVVGTRMYINVLNGYMYKYELCWIGNLENYRIEKQLNNNGEYCWYTHVDDNKEEYIRRITFIEFMNEFYKKQGGEYVLR